MIWASQIVEGYAKDLADALQLHTNAGWTVFAVLTNGVNRWTLILRRGPGDGPYDEIAAPSASV